MLRVEITSVEVTTKSGVSQRSGKPYSIREQEVWVHTCDKEGRVRPHPERVLVTLDEGQAPYPPGSYSICPSSFLVDRFRMLDLRLRLRPANSATVAAAAARSAA